MSGSTPPGGRPSDAADDQAPRPPSGGAQAPRRVLLNFVLGDGNVRSFNLVLGEIRRFTEVEGRGTLRYLEAMGWIGLEVIEL